MATGRSAIGLRPRLPVNDPGLAEREASAPQKLEEPCVLRLRSLFELLDRWDRQERHEL